VRVPSTEDSNIEAAIRNLAERQHGMVSREQLLGFGVTRRQIDGRVVNQRLRRVRRGVYSVGHVSGTERAVWMSAVLAAGRGAVLSHRSAAQLWGFGGWRGPPEVLSPRTGRRRGRRCHGQLPHPIVRRTENLEHHQVTEREGIPVTSVARTLVDLAGVLTETRLSAALNEAEVVGVLDVPDLHLVLSVSRGRRGVARLRGLVALYHPQTGDTKSVLELAFLAMVQRIGADRPRINCFVEGYEVDACWPDRKLVVELDGRRFHGTSRRFEGDREKSAQLELAGWRVLRLTWNMVVNRPRETEAKLIAFRDLVAQSQSRRPAA
jgi:very-short-patch-repair endonuclease